MLRSIDKQSGEPVASFLEMKRTATVGSICRKKGFKPGMKGGDGIQIITRGKVLS